MCSNREVAHSASLVSPWPASASSPCLFLPSPAWPTTSASTARRLRHLFRLLPCCRKPGSRGLPHLLHPLLAPGTPPSPCCSPHSGVLVRDAAVTVGMVWLNGCFRRGRAFHVIPWRDFVMCFMSFHGEICHVFHVIPWGDLSCVSCHSMVRSVVSHVIPWGDLSRISCHSMGRSVSFHYMGRSVVFHSMERSAVLCVMSFHGEICHILCVILWGDLCQICHVSYVISWGDLSYVSCHSVERSAVMCLVSFHGEICHKSHVILWGDQCQICVTCHSMGSSIMCIVILWEILCQICHVSHALPCRDLSCASCHFMGRSTSDMSCVLHYPIRSTLTCYKSDQQGTCLHMPCSFFGCGILSRL